MKRLLVIMILCMVLLTGCGNRTDSQESNISNMFVYIEPQSYNNYYVVYHKDTKVMYAVSAGPYNCGNFTLLVNPDGTPMLYEGK